MKRIERTAEIDVPIEQLFAFVSDPNRLPEWQTGISTARQLTPGPMREGTLTHVVRELMGQRIEVDLRTTEYEPPSRFSLDSDASGFHVEASLLLDPLDEARTAITFAMTVKAGNPFMLPVEGMVVSAAEQDISASLDRLREAFRDGTAATAS